MAYCERRDEFDSEVICIMCDKYVKERRLLNHKASKCEGIGKLMDGSLVKCEYDSSHIVKSGLMMEHLEFCEKHQSTLREKMQKLSLHKPESQFAAYSKALDAKLKSRGG